MQKNNLMGLEMSNPLIIAPGPWSRGPQKLKTALECNAGAIITETIVSESYPDTCPRYAYNKHDSGVQNIRLYTALELESWLDILNEVNNAKRYGSNSKLIASVMGTTASELRYIAKKVEKTGVDGIELGLACPMGEGPEIIAGDPAKVYEYTREVVDSVSIPVSVKLSAAAGNLSAVVHAAEKAGASGISGIDTLKCILSINTDNGKPKLPTYGGYSGSPIRPIALAAVASIVQSTKLPVTGFGGVQNCNHLLEYIMLGASSVGIGTEILLNGYCVIEKILNDLKNWMNDHDVADLDEIRGISLKELKSFEEIKTESKKAEFVEVCNDPQGCGKCIGSCIQNAILGDTNPLQIDDQLCDGCGLCLSICPENKIRLTWK